jgi:hypothetical protein
VLEHVFQHDHTSALRRPACAVCPSWRAAIDINAHVRQAYCDVADVRLLRNFTGLKSVIIDEVDFFGRLMRQRQQRRWALPHQQQPHIPQPFIPSDPINRRSTVGSSTAITTSSSAGRRSRRHLQQTPLAQDLAGLGRLGMFGPPHLDLAPLAQLPGLQDITLRCIHLVKQLPLHAEHLTHVTSLTLHRMHTLQKKRVDDLPRALLPLRNLRRLGLIGEGKADAVGACIVHNLSAGHASTQAAAAYGMPLPVSSQGRSSRLQAYGEAARALTLHPCLLLQGCCCLAPATQR